MKYVSSILFLACWLLLFSEISQAQTASRIPTKPNKTEGLVHDFEGIMTPQEEASLEQKLVGYNNSTSTQISVVTLKSLYGETPALVADEIIEKWGVGDAQKDNGVVIVVSKNDRKVGIGTGYGVEEFIPDIVAQKIIDEDIIPAFKQNRFAQGIGRGIDKVQGYLTGKFTAPANSGGSSELGIDPLILFLLLLFLVLIVSSMLRNRKKDYPPTTYTGNGRRRTIQPQSRRRGRTIVVNPGGGWGDFSRGTGGYGGHYPTPRRRSSGGSSRRSSGGGFGGGSFGGFGGGSSGGGGASGSW